jgi:hypothetical protein
MPHLSRPLAAALLTLAVAAPLACGKRADKDADTASAAQSADAESADSTASSGAAPAPAASESPADAPITAADIDAYERGLAAELAAVRKAQEQMRGAKSANDTLEAMTASLDMQTQPEAAKAAGISVDRYRYLNTVLGGAISARKMNPALANMASQMDTSQLASMPKEAQEQARKNMREMQAQSSDSVIYRDVPPALRDQFKQRVATRLDTLWSELFAARARVAGLAK